MVPVGEGDFFQSCHVAIDVHGMWREEVSLQLVLQQHVVLRRKANACSEKEKEVVNFWHKLDTRFETCTVDVNVTIHHLQNCVVIQ